jgi:flagellar biosynthesis protein
MNDDIPERRNAVAVKYDWKNAPRITAKGQDDLAEKIIEIARAHGVPLHEDARLAYLLSQLDLGEEIPQTLYIVVAEVIAFAYLVSGKAAAYANRRNESPQVSE